MRASSLRCVSRSDRLGVATRVRTIRILRFDLSAPLQVARRYGPPCCASSTVLDARPPRSQPSALSPICRSRTCTRRRAERTSSPSTSMRAWLVSPARDGGPTRKGFGWYSAQARLGAGHPDAGLDAQDGVARGTARRRTWQGPPHGALSAGLRRRTPRPTTSSSPSNDFTSRAGNGWMNVVTSAAAGRRRIRFRTAHASREASFPAPAASRHWRVLAHGGKRYLRYYARGLCRARGIATAHRVSSQEHG